MPEPAVEALNRSLQELRQSLTQITERVQTLQNSSNAGTNIPVFRCPDHQTPGIFGGGAWANYGCTGQISTSNRCYIAEFPTWQFRDCTPIGTIRAQ